MYKKPKNIFVLLLPDSRTTKKTYPSAQEYSSVPIPALLVNSQSLLCPLSAIQLGWAQTLTSHSDLPSKLPCALNISSWKPQQTFGMEVSRPTASVMQIQLESSALNSNHPTLNHFFLKQPNGLKCHSNAFSFCLGVAMSSSSNTALPIFFSLPHGHSSLPHPERSHNAYSRSLRPDIPQTGSGTFTGWNQSLPLIINAKAARSSLFILEY